MSEWDELLTKYANSSNEETSEKQGSEWDQLLAKYSDEKPKEENSDFLSGIQAGTAHTVNLIENQGASALYGILSKITGDPDYQTARDEAFKAYQTKAMEIEEKYPRNVQSFSEAESVGDYIDVVQRGASEGLPMLLGLTPMALAAPEAGVGMLLAAALPDLTIQTLQSDAELKASGTDSLGAAFLMGSAKHGLNYLGKVQALQKVFGKGLEDEVTNSVASKLVSNMTGGRISEQTAARVGNIMSGVAKEGSKFGGISMAQGAVDLAGSSMLSEDKDFFTKENVGTLMEIGASGFLTGGLLGGGARLRGARTPEQFIQHEAQHAADTVNKTQEITDVGTATKYFTDNDLDPTIFSSEEALITAANRLKKRETAQEDYSPALKTLYMDPEGKPRLLTDQRKLSTEPEEIQMFFEQRAQELRNAAILAQPEAQNLVARGIPSEQVVKMPANKIKELSERVDKSYDALTNEHLDTIIVDESGNAMNQKMADVRKATMDKFKQDILTHKAENYNELSKAMERMKRAFLPGDGVIISPTENDAFLGKMQDAFYKNKMDKAQELMKGAESAEPKAAFAPQPKGDYKQAPVTIFDKKKANHPIPESKRPEVVTEPTVKQDNVPAAEQGPELPILKASKNPPENDARVLKQAEDRAIRNAEFAEKAREQKLMPLTPDEAKLHLSTVMPNMVFNNLKMSPPLTEFRGKQADVVKNLERIAKEVGGPHVKFNPVEVLQSIDPYTAEPVATLRGAQYRNLIFTSLEHLNNPKAPLEENVLHEVWHMLANDTNVFTAGDKKLLEIEHSKISQYVRENYDLPPDQLDLMSRTPEGRDEINATAFGVYANKTRLGTHKQPFNSPAKRLFNKALNIITKFSNYLRGAGFRTFEDFFGAVNQGDRQAKASDFQNNILNEMRQARLQVMSHEIQKQHMDAIQEAAKQQKQDMEDAMSESMKSRKNGLGAKATDAAIATRNRWFRSAMGLAHKYEAWRIPVQMGIKLQDKIRGYGTRYASLHEAATKGYTQAEISKVHDLMDQLGRTGQKAQFQLLPDGTPNFDKMTYMDIDPVTGAQKAVVSTDKRFNRLFAQTREQYLQVNQDYENPIRNVLETHGLDRAIPLKELEKTVAVHQKDMEMLKVQEETLKEQIKAAKKVKNEDRVAALEKQQDALILQKKDKERWLSPIEDALEALRDIDARRSVDYVPQMRFGSWGLVVYAKEDLEAHPVTGKLRPIEGRKAQYFGTMESAKFFEKRIGGDARADQHAEHLKEIKRLGLDNPNYVIMGKDAPFFLDRNAIGRELNNRAVTLDLMYGLMNDKNMDAYVSMMQHIKDETALKGFAKHFAKRENIPGYSKEWGRVTPQYLTGAANYIGRREAAPDMITYEAKVKSQMQDDAMKKDLLDYLGYMNNPAEEYLFAREINYLWALGMNPVSAALQAMTLPTSTHMSMNTYNPAPIKNAGYISKWFKKSMKFTTYQHFNKETGKMGIDFANRSVVDNMIKNKAFDPDPVKNKEFGDFFHLMANEGKLEGFYKSSMADRALRSNVTAMDKTYHAMRKTSNIAGIGLSFMETATRIATVMAHYDMIRSEKGVMDRAMRVLKDDKIFQANLKDTRFTPEQHLALFGMDEAHAVFSRAARGTFQRGIAGVLMPFTQYPVQTLEFMGRQLGRGPEGRAALAMNLGMLMVLSGALGLPGASILKDAAEAAYKKASGRSVDFESLLRENLTEMGMTPAMSVMLTQGFSRPVLGVDLGKRIGFGDAIPMADLMLALFGVRGNSVLDSMGVQGSIIKNAGLAWNDYNNGAAGTEVAAKLVPSAISNLLQGYNYGHYGVKTAKGDMLIPPEKADFKTRALKAAGISPGVVADARERMYFTKMKEFEWTDFISQHTKQLSSLRTQRILAMKERDEDKVQKIIKQEKELISTLRKWQKDTGYPLNFTNINNNVKKQVQRNLTGEKPLKEIKKAARASAKKIQDITNISGGA